MAVQFSVEIAERICQQLANGALLKHICEQPGMPGYSTVRRWEKEKEDFKEAVDTARETACHLLADECIQIADDGRNDWMETYNKDGEPAGWKLNGEAANRSRLRIETRMKLLSKWMPKVYGDKVDMNHAGTVRVEKVEFVLVDPKVVTA